MLQDMVEYRFTTDGSDPDSESTLYTKPISFSALPSVIKARAFPKLYFPSQTVMLPSQNGNGTAGPPPVIAQPPGAQSPFDPMGGGSPSPMGGVPPHPASPQASPGQHDSNGPLSSPPASSPFGPSQSQAHGGAPVPQFGQSPPPQVPQGAGSHTAREFQVQWRSKSEREGQSSNLTYMAKCSADGNILTCNFEREVCLERVTISTPGHGKGPASYACSVVQQRQQPNGQFGQHQAHLCEGHLSQDPGEADLEILEYGGLDHVRCIGLRVEFWPLPGEKTFQISQFHLFGTIL